MHRPGFGAMFDGRRQRSDGTTRADRPRLRSEKSRSLRNLTGSLEFRHGFVRLETRPASSQGPRRRPSGSYRRNGRDATRSRFIAKQAGLSPRRNNGLRWMPSGWRPLEPGRPAVVETHHPRVCGERHRSRDDREGCSPRTAHRAPGRCMKPFSNQGTPRRVARSAR